MHYKIKYSSTKCADFDNVIPIICNAENHSKFTTLTRNNVNQNRNTNIEVNIPT